MTTNDERRTTNVNRRQQDCFVLFRESRRRASNNVVARTAQRSTQANITFNMDKLTQVNSQPSPSVGSGQGRRSVRGVVTTNICDCGPAAAADDTGRKRAGDGTFSILKWELRTDEIWHIGSMGWYHGCFNLCRVSS